MQEVSVGDGTNSAVIIAAEMLKEGYRIISEYNIHPSKVIKDLGEEKAIGLKESPKEELDLRPRWLALSILLLWMGWFGFNSGSVLVLNYSAEVVALTTFLAAASSFLSTMFVIQFVECESPNLFYADNGILMGLIVITPLAGFVSPASAVILGLISGPLYVIGEKLFDRAKWFSDPIGLFSGHTLGGLFGLLMIAFFAQHQFAVGSGNPNLPDGLLFGEGIRPSGNWDWKRWR